MTKQKIPFKQSRIARARMLLDEIVSEVSDPLFADETFIGNIRVAINGYHYKIKKEIIKDSFNLPESNWTYNGSIGLFLNDEEETRLALVIPKKGHTKYIYAGLPSGRKIIAALPYELHREIVSAVEEEIGEELYSISGGHIITSSKYSSRPIVTLYGTSIDFGKAEHEEVAIPLIKRGLEVKINQEK